MVRALAALSFSATLLMSGMALADPKPVHASAGQKERSLGEIFLPKVCKSPCGGRLDLGSGEVLCLCVA